LAPASTTLPPFKQSRQNRTLAPYPLGHSRPEIRGVMETLASDLRITRKNRAVRAPKPFELQSARRANVR
jgi:hypothetical protein